MTDISPSRLVFPVSAVFTNQVFVRMWWFLRERGETYWDSFPLGFCTFSFYLREDSASVWLRPVSHYRSSFSGPSQCCLTHRLPSPSLLHFFIPCLVPTTDLLFWAVPLIFPHSWVFQAYHHIFSFPCWLPHLTHLPSPSIVWPVAALIPSLPRWHLLSVTHPCGHILPLACPSLQRTDL